MSQIPPDDRRTKLERSETSGASEVDALPGAESVEHDDDVAFSLAELGRAYAAALSATDGQAGEEASALALEEIGDDVYPGSGSRSDQTDETLSGYTGADEQYGSDNTNPRRSDRKSAQDGQNSDASTPGDPPAIVLEPRSILEAILFVGTPDQKPLSAKRLASIMQDVSPREIDQWVAELNQLYQDQQSALTIVQEQGGYRMVLADQLGSIRNAFFGEVREARMSQAAIDVLAIVAYNQPVTSQRIDALRGRSSAAILAQLVRRRLLQIEIAPVPPRVKSYRTTDRFLQLFSLHSLDELPQSSDFPLEDDA